MKIKALSRSEEQYTRECKGDVVKVFRNTDAALHPFDKAREYTRALQATKLDKVFAKPFLGGLVVVERLAGVRGNVVPNTAVDSRHLSLLRRLGWSRGQCLLLGDQQEEPGTVPLW